MLRTALKVCAGPACDLQAREKELYEASRWREDGDVDDIKKEGEPESKKKSLIRSLSSKEGVA